MMSANYPHAVYGSSCMVARLASIEASWSCESSKHFIVFRELPPSAVQTVKRVLDN